MNQATKDRYKVMTLVWIELVLKILTLGIANPQWSYQLALKNAREAFARNHELRRQEQAKRERYAQEVLRAEAMRNTIIDTEDS